MKAVIDHLKLLKEPMTLCFSYYEKVPAPDSDVIIKHYHVLDSIIIETRPLSPHEFSKLIKDSHKTAITYLTNFYYDNIESESKLHAIYKDLNIQLSEIPQNRIINTEIGDFYYSSRVSLHVQKATEKCQDSDITNPSYYDGIDVNDLTFERHYQIIRTLNELANNERKYIESIWSLLKNFDKKPPKAGLRDKISEKVLKSIYKNFSQYLEYASPEEFLAAVNNMEEIKIKEGYKNHIAHLFHSVLKAEKITGRTAILINLCGVRNKSRDALGDKPIMKEIDAFMEGYSANIQT